MQPNSSHEITALLAELRKGNKQAEEQLIPLVYKELHRLSRHYMRGEKHGHTLQPSALVNEVYMRLAGEHNVDWKNRAHFFGTAANIMRRILVDHARTRDAEKRGGAAEKVSLENAFVYTDAQSWQVVAIHEALNKLEEWDQRQCRIVEMRFFAGLNVEETAEAMGISPTTVKREFQMAKAWLYGVLSKDFGQVSS
ncbi:MAG TPA: sigma-70 family RNA polymerase sigma factor [Candidatus Angelobacter sp.]|nr:sigma-70 family RNA polymerase sigma factor [Candidatus Angelobacter sp.]